MFQDVPRVPLWALAGLRVVLAQGNNSLPDFDFTRSPETSQWKALHHISQLVSTPEGLLVQISGPDPYLAGPARDYPAGQFFWMHLRLKSEQGGFGQVFYFAQAASETNSVRFSVPASEWHEVQVPVPALGESFQLRIDPPGTSGDCLLGRVWFESRVVFQPPEWPAPVVPALGSDAVVLDSADLKLTHSRTEVGGLTVDVAGQRMATGYSKPQLGYVLAGQVRWVPMNTAQQKALTVERTDGAIEVQAAWRDPDGATWKARRAIHRRGGRRDPDREHGSRGSRSVSGLLAALDVVPGARQLWHEQASGPASWSRVPGERTEQLGSRSDRARCLAFVPGGVQADFSADGSSIQ